MFKSLNFTSKKARALACLSGTIFCFLSIRFPIESLGIATLFTVLLLSAFLVKIDTPLIFKKNPKILITAAAISLLASGNAYRYLVLYEELFNPFLKPVLDVLGLKTCEIFIALLVLLGGVLSVYFCYYILGLTFCLLNIPKAAPLLAPKKSRNCFYVISFILVFLFCLASANTSSLNSRALIQDEGIFATVGKSWAEGKIPYSEIFDHKGPLIFFIYAISYYLTSSAALVFLAVVVSIWLSMAICFRMVSKYCGKGVGAISSIVTFFYLYVTFATYGFTEIFCLPSLMAGMYFSVTYFVDKKPLHPIKGALVYGIAIGVSLTTRLTNCVIICAGVLAVFVDLIIKKKFKNLLLNLLFGILGISLVVVPFLAYFALKESLAEAIFGTLIYNISYATSSGARPYYEFFQMLYLLLPTAGALCLTAFKKGCPGLKFFVFVSAILSTYVVAGGTVYQHYYTVLAIYIPLCFVLLGIKRKSADVTDTDTEQISSAFVMPGKIFVASLCLCSIVMGIFFVKIPETEYEQTALEQSKLIPEEDRELVIGYDVGGEWYLKTDITPCFKYFILQDFQSSKNEKMLKENLEFYSAAKAKWVVVRGEIKTPEIKAAVNKNYFVVDMRKTENSGDLYLYKRKF